MMKLLVSSGSRSTIVTVSLLLAACSSTSESADTAAAAPTTQAAVPVETSAVEGDNALTQPASKDFAPLNQAVGFGLLRVMSLEERPNALDVVIYEALPNELPRVAGVITTVSQTPLSHVNLRAVQDKVPNAYVADALARDEVKALIGRYVKYQVTVDGFTVESASQAEVEAHHQSARPTTPQTPQRNLTVRKVAALTDIGFDDWTTYGVKAANVAVLGTLDLPQASTPDGFAVPFSFYDEFMKANGFYDRVSTMLADPTFRSDPAKQDDQLKDLRDDIEEADLPDWMMDELTTTQKSFPEGTSIRCRSSTNNEDLPSFSGAGLYDSRTQHPDEGHLSKCIKQVYASVWNLRAFLERDFYRIDHMSTAMGVLLHPNFSDEIANGVAVSVDPVYETPGAYYVNTQLGEDLVTNPEALSVPEALLLGEDGSTTVVNRSNLAKPGQLLMTEAQTTALRSSLSEIHSQFAKLYEVEPGEKFAMEVEFKITAAGALAIKQARTWIFN